MDVETGSESSTTLAYRERSMTATRTKHLHETSRFLFLVVDGERDRSTATSKEENVAWWCVSYRNGRENEEYECDGSSLVYSNKNCEHLPSGGMGISSTCFHVFDPAPSANDCRAAIAA